MAVRRGHVQGGLQRLAGECARRRFITTPRRPPPTTMRGPESGRQDAEAQTQQILQADDERRQERMQARWRPQSLSRRLPGPTLIFRRALSPAASEATRGARGTSRGGGGKERRARPHAVWSAHRALDGRARSLSGLWISSNLRPGSRPPAPATHDSTSGELHNADSLEHARMQTTNAFYTSASLTERGPLRGSSTAPSALVTSEAAASAA